MNGLCGGNTKDKLQVHKRDQYRYISETIIFVTFLYTPQCYFIFIIFYSNTDLMFSQYFFRLLNFISYRNLFRTIMVNEYSHNQLPVG